MEDIAPENTPRGAAPRRVGRRAKALPTEAERRERRLRWLFTLFMIALLIPGSFFIGTARLTPYRAFLLLAVLPLLWQVVRGALGRLTAVDVLFVCYASWIALATLVHEGIERYEFIIVLTVESLFGYLFGRVLVRNVENYKLLIRIFLMGILALVPFALLEMLTKYNLLSEIASKLMEPHAQATHPPRLGLFRAQVSFEHPILFGLFCSLGFANAFYVFLSYRRKQLFWMSATGFATFASLSSAPMLALLLQSLMITWDRIVRNLKSKWFILLGIGILTFLMLQILTPNGAVDFLVNNLTLVPETAEYRILTLQYVIDQVFEYPIFGIPDEAVDLPWWHTGSVDNFWLSTASAYGIPTTLFLFLAIVLHLFGVMSADMTNESASDIRTGHLIAVTALIFLLTTVHIWGAASVMIMTYLGAGAWIYAPERTTTSLRTDRKQAEQTPRISPVVSSSPAGKNSGIPMPSRPGSAGRVRGSTGRYGGSP